VAALGRSRLGQEAQWETRGRGGVARHAGMTAMSEARPGSGAGATPDIRGTTHHQEMADRLGMTAEGARQRAEREGWPSLLPGDDNHTRVGVPGGAAGHDAAEDGADDRPEAAAAPREAPARERERADRAESERDALREGLLAARAAAEDAGQRAKEADERAEAAHLRAADLAAVLERAAERLERLRAERDAALAKAEAATRRAGEAEARAAEVRRRADEAKRRAGEADERLESFLRERITAARAEAERQGHEAAERELAARTVSGVLLRVSRAFRRRRGEP
jgi:hypothetical protein